MKVWLVLLFIALTAVSVLGYGDLVGAAGTRGLQGAWIAANEPAALLISGSFLLALAGVVRRLTV